MPQDAYPLDQSGAVPAAEIAADWGRELPSTPVGSITVITPLWRIAKIMADDRRRTLSLLGVEAATLDLLSTLRREGEPYTLSTRELASRCLVTAGAISQRVARAESNGYVERTAASGRPRTVMVTLTPHGHDLVVDAVARLLAHEEELLADLTTAQRDQLASLLETLLAALSHREDSAESLGPDQ